MCLRLVPVISYPTRVFCSGASRGGSGRPATLYVGAAGRSAAVYCVRGGGGGFVLGGGGGGLRGKLHTPVQPRDVLPRRQGAARVALGLVCV